MAGTGIALIYLRVVAKSTGSRAGACETADTRRARLTETFLGEGGGGGGSVIGSVEGGLAEQGYPRVESGSVDCDLHSFGMECSPVSDYSDQGKNRKRKILSERTRERGTGSGRPWAEGHGTSGWEDIVSPR